MNLKNEDIILNVNMCDFYTLTTYDVNVESLMRDAVKDWYDSVMKVTPAKRIQYIGGLASVADGSRTGTAFLGQGEQKGKPHYMLQMSGQLAHMNILLMMNRLDGYDYTMTRFDAQCTIEQPATWQQKDLMIRQLERDAELGWKQNQRRQKGRLVTVYMGNRETGHRFARIYQKIAKDQSYLLRLEVECKRDRARAIGRRLMRYFENYCESADELLSEILKAELQSYALKDSGLHTAFAHQISGLVSKTTVSAVESNTLKWANDVAMGVIERLVYSHDVDTARLEQRMRNIIRRIDNV